MSNFSNFSNLDQNSYYALGGSALLIGLTALWWRSQSKQSAHPPGPKPKFLVKNLFDYPSSRSYEVFTEMRKEYGDVIYMEIANMTLLDLSSLKEVEELLVRNDNIFSGRGPHAMVNELMDFQWSVLMTPPGPVHNELRKIFRKVIGAQSVTQYDYMIEQEASAYVQRISGFSGDPLDFTQDSIGTVMVKLAYGENIHRTHGKELIQLNTETITLITWAFSQPWLPNIVSITRYLPSWFPGISFPGYARQGNELVQKLRYWAYGLVLEAEKEGKADPSVITRYLHDPDVSKDYLRDATALMYFGGVDTTTSALLNFILFMLLYPDVQKKVQAELDANIGHSRTPNMKEALSLPYLKAVWKETLRMVPPIPLGVPHATIADHTFKGYHIPKGTLIQYNVGYMMRDPKLWGPYGKVDEFDPDRFLPEINPGANQLPDVSPIFGFGRRICPGRYIADRSGILYGAAILSTYDILPVEGEPPVTMEFIDNLIRRPSNLRCRFAVRQ